MVHVVFTQNLQRHVPCPPAELAARTVGEALDGVFAGNPGARGYVLDEQGALRKHMIVFINGEQIKDRAQLSDPVPEGGEIYVMQALSGGSESDALPLNGRCA
jgi:sulfur-carrier protein